MAPFGADGTGKQPLLCPYCSHVLCPSVPQPERLPFSISLHFSISPLAHPSAHQVGLGEVDDFIPPSVENGFDHEKAKALNLVDGNGRGHGEFLPAHNCFNQGRPVMTKCL